MKLEFFGSKILETICDKVESITEELRSQCNEMIELMYRSNGIGLAAPQVGISKRFFVYDIRDGSGAHTIINPILAKPSGHWTSEEGCLSIPDISYLIRRPKTITLFGKDLNNKPLKIEASMLLARLFQHEVNHLSGHLYIEKLNKGQLTDFTQRYPLFKKD